MKPIIFKGAAVAIVTPFMGPDGEKVNFDELGRLIDFQIDNGTDAIVICGTTGEASTMPDAEHLSVIEYAVKKVAKRVPVIAGTGSNDTKHAIYLTTTAEKLGADAVLSVTPYYNKATQAGLIEHFTRIANSIKIPVILYNVPSRTGVNIAPDTLAKLAQIPNINAVKECNLSQLTEVHCKCGDNLNIYSGEDGHVTTFIGAGALGVISVVSNVFPRYVHDMATAMLEGNTAKAWKMQADELDIVKALFMEVNPIPVKEALNYMGWNAGPCRLPLCNMIPDNRAKLEKAIEEFKVKL